MTTNNVFIIDTVSLEICGEKTSHKVIIEELKKKVKRKYPNFEIAEDDIVGMLDMDEERIIKMLSRIFRNECAVLVKGICKDVKIVYFFRLLPTSNMTKN